MITRDSRGSAAPTGAFASIDGEDAYRISAYDRMPPFLMTLASDTDLWMFLTSGGGLTAGRVDAEGSLFPYETVDRLHDAHHHTGPVTCLRVGRPDRDVLWQPFSGGAGDAPAAERHLAKNLVGNRITFEEIRRDLGLAFRYRWTGCDDLGFVRTCTLENQGSAPARIELLDGFRNVLPYGAPLALYQQSSSLVDAYKRSDVDEETQLGVFSLTAKIVDRAEAAEMLRANVVWCHGLPRYDVALSGGALSAFRNGEPFPPESVLTGRRGNYLVRSRIALAPGSAATWHLVADVGRSHVQLGAIRARLLDREGLSGRIEDGLRTATRQLVRNVASADGLQLTGSREASAHHFANVLFNNMRGGVFSKNYDVPVADFTDFLGVRNRPVGERHAQLLRGLPAEIRISDLLRIAEESGDPDLQRLSHEYLPIWFGRRHGDPSRPWNRFRIHVRDADGSRALRYEGNWRDIFQNWEALSLSFPGFLPSLIAKFVNASTVDGFNPYRVTRDGVDWEIVEPDDPWSYIGYWGDHQIIYLLKFLEALPRFAPGVLESLLEREIFSYANVPYRIHPYEQMLRDPSSTITFDQDLAGRIDERVRAVGTDGKLLPDGDGAVHHVSLLEKLLVPALSKVSNLVPDGGIWMNTQRPEWNDANNALVGNGLSLVTLSYLRRYLRFLVRLLESRPAGTASVSSEVSSWLQRLRSVLAGHRALLESPVLGDPDRKRVLDELGGAFSDYRASVYASGFSGKAELGVGEITGFCRDAIAFLDHALRANRRDDGLFHSYNLLHLSGDGTSASVHPLYEMLEGQVAALSSGFVKPAQAVELLARLFDSRLYREDARSFLLYPERELPAFLDRNVVPDDEVSRVPLLRALLEARDGRVIERDALGVCRFHGDFQSAASVADALERLAADEAWREPVARDREAVLTVFESVFRHRTFTGRSGTMYGYEGLGCIYWHMVAKLLLAVQEIALGAVQDGEPAPVVQELIRAYYRVRSGLGFEKSAAEYGAFPTDPYSHTPAHSGAKQPGMTGQVKEEILTRFGELGAHVDDGALSFRPWLLRKSEFLSRPAVFSFHDVEGRSRSIDLPSGALAFTFCQVPVTYELTDTESWVRVTRAGGDRSTEPGLAIDAERSRSLFEHRGEITRIEVGVPESLLAAV